MSALSAKLRAKSQQPFGPEDFELLTLAADEIERLEQAVLAERIACAAIAGGVNNFDNPMTASDVEAAILSRGEVK